MHSRDHRTRPGARPDPDDLRPRQRQILDLIRRTVATRGYPPSVREIGEHLGLRSPATVHSHLTSLVKAGLLRRDPTKPRAIEVVGFDLNPDPTPAQAPTRDVPLLGRIAAGSPILAEEHVEDVMPLPESLVGSGPLFMLEVHGDSMTGVGILDGDLVVVRSQPDAENGQIVACLIDGIDGEKATVKRLEKRQGEVILHSENPAYEPMIFTSGVVILGKVVTVLRRLQSTRARISRESFR